MKKIILILMLLCISSAYGIECGIVTTNLILENDISSENDCLIIGSDDLVIDGNGHSLAGNNTGIAINAAGRRGITIKNFIITGFAIGINLETSGNSIVENNQITSQASYSKGINSMSSDNVQIRNNNIVMENIESAAVYISNQRGGAIDSNRVLCKREIFEEQTTEGCVYLANIYDYDISNNNIQYQTGAFYPANCVRIRTGQNNKFHDNTISGYCLALTAQGERGSEYYSNIIDTYGGRNNIFTRGFTFADGGNNLIRDNEVSSTYLLFNINKAYSSTYPEGYVVSNMKMDGNLILSSDRLTEINILGNRLSSNVVPDYEGKISLGKFKIDTYDSDPGYIQFSIKYDPSFNGEEINEDSVGLYYHFNTWKPLPGATVDKDTNTINVNIITFPTSYSGNHLKLGVWADKKVDSSLTEGCQPDCTKGDNIAHKECVGIGACSGVSNVIIINKEMPYGCDNQPIGVNISHPEAVCVNNRYLYVNYMCRKGTNRVNNWVNVVTPRTDCVFGCQNGVSECNKGSWSKACPSFPCFFDGKSGLNVDRSFDSPPNYISSSDYPYEFTLDRETKVNMTLNYSLGSQTQLGTNYVKNYLYIYLDNKVVFTDDSLSAFGKGTQQKTIEFGLLQPGTHYLRMEASPYSGHWSFDWFNLTGEGYVQADLCQPDCTKGDNIAYLECQLKNGCKEVETNYIDPSGTGETIAGCDGKTIDNVNYFLNSYCIGDMIYESYSCKKNVGGEGNTVDVTPIGIACENGCENRACIDDSQEDTEAIEGTCPSSKIIVCHNTDIEICVANSSVNAHLEHGDALGRCSQASQEIPPEETLSELDTLDEIEPNHDGCPQGKILICHISEHKNTICISPAAFSDHMSHGDYEGPCVNEDIQTKKIEKINENQKIDILFENDVKISFKAMKEKQNTKITAKVRDVVPKDIPPPNKKVKEYIIIEHVDIDNSEIEESKIEFNIDRKWLDSNNAKEEDVILSKYLDTWKDLKTRYVRSDGDILYFEADSEGFSTFAVTLNNTVASLGEKLGIIKQEEYAQIPEYTVDETEKEDSISTPLFLGVVLFLIVVLLLAVPPPKKKDKKTDPEKERYREVLEFVNTLKSKKKTDVEIKKELGDAGWSKADIDKIILLYSGKKK